MNKHSLYEYFYFTRAERNASIVLSVICVIFFILPCFYTYLRPEPPNQDFKEFRKMIAPVVAQMEANQKTPTQSPTNLRGEPEKNNTPQLFFFDPNTASKEELVLFGLSSRTAQTVLKYRNKGGQFRKVEDFKKLYTLRPEEYERLAPWISFSQEETARNQEYRSAKETVKVVEHFPFDPNTASVEEFKRLGLPGRTAHSILNYREKGGRFYKKEDFGKIYTLDSMDYNRLESWIEIIKAETAQDTATHYISRNEELLPASSIDINHASLEDWEKIRGIGPGYARRIMEYREELGGFNTITQIAETYGLPDSTFQEMIKYLEKPTGPYRKIKINSANLKDLQKHPYLSNFQANILFNYRKQHGRFQGWESLKKIRAGFSEKDWKRLLPYFSFE